MWASWVLPIGFLALLLQMSDASAIAWGGAAIIIAIGFAIHYVLAGPEA
jgi:hypothetical protein